MLPQISLDPDFFDDTELIEAWDRANGPNRQEESDEEAQVPVGASAGNFWDPSGFNSQNAQNHQNSQNQPNLFNCPLPNLNSFPPFPFPSDNFGPSPPPTPHPKKPSDIAFSNMIMAWYYAGYYTGQYQTWMAMNNEKSSTSSSSSGSSGASES